jgi:RND family efflux transporter MFP subunit
MQTLKRLFSRTWVRVLAVLAVIVVGYGIYRAVWGTQTAATEYVTAKAAKGTLVVSVEGSGQVASVNQTNIQPQISGTVAAVAVVNNQRVKAGDLLVRLDTTNEERAVRNAQASLENTRLALETLMEPATTSSILQAQNSVAQAKQSLSTDQNNLASDYSAAYTGISNTFIDLPGVVTGLNTVLHQTTINRSQANVDAYTDLVRHFSAAADQYNQSAVSSYQTALAAYNQNLTDYKNSNVYSSTSTVGTLLDETYTTVRAIAAANGSVKNMLDFVSVTLQQRGQTVPAQLAADEASLQSYTTTINNRLATLLQIKNSLVSDEQAIAAAALSIAQTSASLDQLMSGPTQLDVQTKRLSVTQAENALTDAKQNLAYDYVRAPYDGVVTNVTAKVAQPVGSGTTVAVLLSNTQLAQATLNEVDVVNVKVGQQATVTFDALPELTSTGKVSQVDTLGTVVQGVVSYAVQVALDVPNPQVRPGMSDGVSIIVNVRQDALMVPNVAVSTKQNVSTVQVLGADGTPSTVEVTTGLMNDTMTEITSGLTEGDAVVTRTVTGAATTQSATTGGLGGLRIPGLGGGGR